jgi:hypothetical protein
MATEASAAPGAEPLRALPSGRFLFGLIQSVTDEVIAHAYHPGARAEYPIMEQLWIHCQALAKARLKQDPADEASVALKARWAELDKVCGTPVSRFWRLDHSEAVLREQAMVVFVYGTGLFAHDHAEVDAPRQYLADEQKEGS